MADFKLDFGDLYQTDIEFGTYDFEQDEGLKTAVIISLFSDRRITTDEAENQADRRGWFADHFETEKLGSRLWLLARAKELPETLRLAKDYVTEALAWMISDNVAREITVETSWQYRGQMLIIIRIYRPSGEDVDFEFSPNWEAEFA